MYNIITLANSSYFKFLSILINSSLDKCNFDNINAFYIVNTGLSSEQIKWIENKHTKFKILTTELNTSYEGGPWGHDWMLNVKNKTSFLYDLFLNTKIPLLLVDSDMMFVNDPSTLIKEDIDLLLCSRPGDPLPAWNLKKNIQLYIASFVFILNTNKDEVINFLYDWKEQVLNTKIYPPESPNLSKVVDLYKEKLNIVGIDESIVNVLFPHQLNDASILVHFKGSDLIKDLNHQYNKRINEKGWSNFANKYLENV